MGSYKWGYGVRLRVPLKGSIGVLGFSLAFRGSFKWGYKSPNMGDKYRYPTYLLPTTHEPLSMGRGQQKQSSTLNPASARQKQPLNPPTARGSGPSNKNH